MSGCCTVPPNSPSSTDGAGRDPDEQLSTVQLCRRCMAGEGGECHTPGCSLWMNRAPDIPVSSAATVTASQGADVDLRPFPMLDGPPIPWYVARSVYVHLYGPGEQTLDRIGERGGFGWGEVALMWKDKAARRVSDRDRERCAAEIEAAGTLAAEPPHDPKERT